MSGCIEFIRKNQKVILPILLAHDSERSFIAQQFIFLRILVTFVQGLKASTFLNILHRGRTIAKFRTCPHPGGSSYFPLVFKNLGFFLHESVRVPAPSRADWDQDILGTSQKSRSNNGGTGRGIPPKYCILGLALNAALPPSKMRGYLIHSSNGHRFPSITLPPPPHVLLQSRAPPPPPPLMKTGILPNSI